MSSVVEDFSIPDDHDELVLKFKALRKEVLKLRQENTEMKETIEKYEDDNDSVSSSSDNEGGDAGADGIDKTSSWFTKFEQLKAYKQKNGDCKVSQKDGQLGNFVKFQRQCYGKFVAGKSNPGISQQKVDLLNSIGMYWGKQFGEPKNWNDWANELDEKVSELGVKPKKIARDTDLGKWIHGQRKELKRLRKGQPSSLNTDQAKRLMKLGL